MAALRRSADEQGGLNQTTDGAGALNVHAALTIADHRRDRAATPGSPHCASFDARSVRQARIDRPVDKRRESHQLQLPRLQNQRCE
jgi:hypothetical protein